MYICVREKREDREGGKWGRRKKEGQERLQTGEEERKYMTMKYRYHSSCVHFILLPVKLSKIGGSTFALKEKITDIFSKGSVSKLKQPMTP